MRIKENEKNRWFPASQLSRFYHVGKELGFCFLSKINIHQNVWLSLIFLWLNLAQNRCLQCWGEQWVNKYIFSDVFLTTEIKEKSIGWFLVTITIWAVTLSMFLHKELNYWTKPASLSLCCIAFFSQSSQIQIYQEILLSRKRININILLNRFLRATIVLKMSKTQLLLWRTNSPESKFITVSHPWKTRNRK